ncbi:hypothetical protein HOY82DRAFT_534687 [Tuber indicum]|nr:hypothetical protein HOY82DRAFT_534687 [Tuber indicum]
MDVILEQPRDSGNSQTSAQYPVMNGIGTLSSIPAGECASPSLPIPMQHVDPASQQLQQIEARWYQWYRDKYDRHVEESFLRYQECDSVWYQRCESKNREILEKSVEIASLIVESSLQVYQLCLTGMQMELLHEKTERLKLEHKFNLCGALVVELIVHHAKLIKIIASNQVSGIQDGIDKLAGSSALVAALQDETAARQLTLDDVTAHVACIYNTVSKYASGNDLIITLYEDHYTREECAVLAAFLRVQNEWPGGFQCMKVKRRG